jgi:hypothetical protein
MNVKPSQKYALGAILMLLALVVMYPLSVGPLALLHGAGMFDDKAVDAIRPIYAPLRPLVTKTRAGGLLVRYEMLCDALGRRLRK